MIEHIPALADKAAEAISNIKIDKIVMWGCANGNNNGHGKQAGAGVSALVTDLVGALPPALHTMLNIGGVKVADGLVKIVEDEAARRPGVPTPAGGD